MSKLNFTKTDKFHYFIFDKSEFTSFLDDDDKKITDLEIIEQGMSNIIHLTTASDDRFYISKLKEDQESLSYNDIYEADEDVVDSYRWILVWYSEEKDITITLELMEEWFNVFKGDPLELKKLFGKK